MKKLLCILGVSMFARACNNESDSATATKSDTVDTAPVNDMSNPNHAPGSNTPGEAMGNGDTASYERMPQKIDSSK